MSAVALFLKAIDPRVWLAVAAALIFIAYTAAVYHAGGIKPRAAFAKLEADVKTAHAEHVKEDARREANHLDLVKGKDNERAQAIDTVAASWSSYADSLQHAAPGRARADAKPVPVAAERCNDASGNQDVSAAVSSYRDDVRSAVADLRAAFDGFRDADAKRFAVCDKQTGALIRVQEWAGAEREINR